MNVKRKIMAVTGARSEYDILFPVLKELKDNPLADVSVLVTGSHLAETYGKTVSFIEKDGFRIADKIYSLVQAEEKIARIVSLGYQLPALAHAFNREKPDFILVVGDREEAISTTMAGAFLGIPVAHIAGGDIAKDGNIDNSIRYASSKFAHLHFVILPEHKNTLLKLGEDEWRIQVVGNPALDRFLQSPIYSIERLSTELGFAIEPQKYLLLIQHPIVSEVEREKQHMIETLEAVLRFGMPCLINSPNSDAGNFSIASTIAEYAQKHPNLFVFKNLERNTYINLMRNAFCLLGNSSSGIIEAPSLQLPVINIGKRQRGRTHADNVIFVDNNEQEILNALNFVQKDQLYREKLLNIVNPYGEGDSAKKIAQILMETPITDSLLYKNISYE